MAEAVRGVSLLRLAAWLSPSFPVGSFAYSSGLERAVADGRVSDAADLRAWLETILEEGSGWNDAIFFCQAARHARAAEELVAVCELAEALAASRERHLETMAQGSAFLAAIRNWPDAVLPEMPERAPYCVAVGATAGVNGLPVVEACAVFLLSVVSAMAQAGIRLSIAGQMDAVTLTGTLAPRCEAVASRAAAATLDDLGSATIMADIMSMKHETQYSRLFRS